MDLREELLEWDGKGKAVLETTASNLAFRKQEVETLLQLAEGESPTLQLGATWLLKHGLEEGLVFTSCQTKILLRLLKKVLYWEAHLHLLQILPSLEIPKTSSSSLFTTLKSLLKSTNKFVRAWTFNGFYILADRYPEYREEVLPLLQEGLQEESGSVRARIRNAVKRSSWA